MANFLDYLSVLSYFNGMQNGLDTLKILEKLKNARVLAVGDVMLDRFIYGDAVRISPEAPVPVLKVAHETLSAGGVGNVAANVCGLGASCTLIGVSGDDSARAQLLSFFEKLPNLSVHLIADTARPTIQKDRYIARGQHVLRVDHEEITALSPDTENAVIASIVKYAQETDVIIASDYGKGVISPRVLAALFATGKPVFIDPKGCDYARYRGASLLTPNLSELAEAAGGMPVTEDADVVAAAQVVLEKTGAETLLATRSAKGMTLVEKTGEVTHIPARVREVYDVSGAGDTVIATLATCIAAGADRALAAQLANMAAGVVVQKSGTAAIALSDLMPQTPDLSWNAARAQCDAWRAQGLKVGFTNGCFDILHTGHVTMLARARAQCDRLILGLNADASVRRLKGPTRPVNNEQARASVVAALASIDGVVLFGTDASENDTPLKLIEALAPDILFKGADYTHNTVVGADFVTARGGSVILVPLEEGFSTTATINKMGSAA